MKSFDIFNTTLIVIITAGLVLFTFMLYISRRSKKAVKKRRSRIIDDWKDRL